MHRFERLAALGRAALGAGDPVRAAGLLREALAVWRGPALADVGAAPFAAGQIARIEEPRLAALEDRIAADLALGAHRDLVPELRDVVAANPLRERPRAKVAGRGGPLPRRYPVLMLLWETYEGVPTGSVPLESTEPSDVWSGALMRLGDGIQRWLGQAELAGSDAELDRALTEFRAVGGRWGRAMALSWRAFLAAFQDQPRRAIELFDQALALSAELDADQEMAESWRCAPRAWRGSASSRRRTPASGGRPNWPAPWARRRRSRGAPWAGRERMAAGGVRGGPQPVRTGAT